MLMTAPKISLNPSLDLAAFAERYRSEQFVQIPNFFSDETASYIETVLRQNVAWRLIYIDPDKGVQSLSKAQIQELGAEAMHHIMQGILQRASRNYGYCYNGYQMLMAWRAGDDPGHPLHAVTEFLNAPEFRGLGEAIIGETGLTQTDAQATLFSHGNFLTRHIDDGAQNERRAAYTLSFSRNWQTDWGGLLQLINQKTTDVTSAWIPRFNTLTIFDGRNVHAVSPVSNFAGDGRYSIVGWFRNDPVPSST